MFYLKSRQNSQADGEGIFQDSKGRLWEKGVLLTDAALEQRLRRWTAIKKSGKITSGEDARNMFYGGSEKRQELVDMYKSCGLNKARFVGEHLQLSVGSCPRGFRPDSWYFQQVACYSF